MNRRKRLGSLDEAQARRVALAPASTVGGMAVSDRHGTHAPFLESLDFTRLPLPTKLALPITKEHE